MSTTPETHSALHRFYYLYSSISVLFDSASNHKSLKVHNYWYNYRPKQEIVQVSIHMEYLAQKDFTLTCQSDLNLFICASFAWGGAGCPPCGQGKVRGAQTSANHDARLDLSMEKVI